MNLVRTIAPATPIMDLAAAKEHLREETAAADSYIATLVAAAEAHLDGAAGILGRALIDQTWTLTLDDFPAAAITLPLPPLQSVGSIKYIDTAGVEQTWPAAQYQITSDDRRAEIAPAYGQSWPVARAEAGAVRVVFIAGYGPAASDVPAAIVHAAKFLVGHWYENREAVMPGAQATETPLAVDRLVGPYRVRREF